MQHDDQGTTAAGATAAADPDGDNAGGYEDMGGPGHDNDDDYMDLMHGNEVHHPPVSSP